MCSPMKNKIDILSAFIICLCGIANSKYVWFQISLGALFIGGLTYKTILYLKQKGKDEPRLEQELKK